MGVSRLGLDPEVSLLNTKTGLARSAHLLVGDEKYTCTFHASGSSMDGSEFDRDGAALEVRSIVDSACRDNIIPYVAEAMRIAQLKTEDWDSEFALSSNAVFELDEDSFIDAPTDVLEFGCNPDMDAYTLQPKAPTLTEGDVRRYTGGHVHASAFRGLKNNVQEQAALAIAYDYAVALPYVAMLGYEHHGTETLRRTFYGQPGSFRFDDKRLKIEFRTLSGQLLRHPVYLAWVLGMTRALGNVRHKSWQDAVKEYFVPVASPDRVYEIIMTHDVDAARELTPLILQAMPNYKEEERALANPLGGGGGGTLNPYFFEQAFNVFMAGHDEGIRFGDDLKFNWGLYDNYEPKHHAYWGIQTAMVKLCDDDIFPFNKVVDKVWPKGFFNTF